jgi:signal transduction histidine kinase/response regulator RpfG family c-di-GMP phosphodiesterase/HPt (histidine-containing phosphotransfer) domain-containing protein
MHLLLIGQGAEEADRIRRTLTAAGQELTAVVFAESAERWAGGRVKIDADVVVCALEAGAVLDTVRALAAAAPLVVLLREADGVLAERAIALGAQDCLVQGTFDGATLRRVLLHAVVRKRAEQELVRAVDAARGVDRAKRAFLANMSHEIRTPLSGVLGMAGALLETGLTARQREYVEVLRRSGEGLMQVINEVLEFSRIEAGRLVLEVAEFDLRLAVEETVEPFALRAQEKGLEFICLFEPGTPRMLIGDTSRLRQMMAHLACNAVKFTDRGEVAVRVSGRREAGRAVAVRFEVRDTGCGVAAEGIARLFDPFEHAQAVQRGGSGGPGLGLAITRHLAQMMGGDVGVESQLGGGSRFWFTVVLPGSERAPEGPEEGDRLAGWRLLVAEGNAASRGVVATYLRQYGALVTEVERLGEAWAALLKAGGEGEPFRAALVADRLPDGLPLDLIARIHMNPVLKRTVFILLAPLARLGSVRVLRELGIAAVVGSPVKSGDLLAALGVLPSPEGEAGGGRVRAVESRRRRWPGVQVLLVEDDPTLQKVMQVMLERVGCGVGVASNGHEAIRMLRHTPFDLVFMDCQMPGMSGLETARAIREPSSGVLRPDVPIVTMSASLFDSGGESRLAAGIDGFLSKPVRQEALVGVLERWFGPGTAAGSEAGLEQAEAGAVSAPGAVQEPSGVEADFDAAGFRESTLGDRELGEQVIRLFLEQSTEHIEAMRSALAAGDSMRVSQQAHVLNGNAAQVGGTALRLIARQVEEASRQGDLGSAGARIGELEAAHRRLCVQLRDYLGGQGQSKRGTAKCPEFGRIQ